MSIATDAGSTELAAVTSVKEIPLQDTSRDIWETKYRLTSKSGDVIDATVDNTFERVARALADV
ncbi:MAG: hypothetical protein AAFQ16_08305, partial [Pseudomonadota bacterium]